MILRGYAGLRKVLSASRYLTTNPKVIAYGMTRVAAAAGGALNVIITIVVLVPMEIIRHLMGEQTLSEVFGNVLTGTMVAALASAASFGVLAVGTMMAVSAPAWLIVGGMIIVGLLASKLLGDLAKALNVSGFIAMTLDEVMQRLAEEEARKARGQRVLGQFYHDNPGFRHSAWSGFFTGPRR